MTTTDEAVTKALKSARAKRGQFAILTWNMDGTLRAVFGLRESREEAEAEAERWREIKRTCVVPESMQRRLLAQGRESVGQQVTITVEEVN